MFRIALAGLVALAAYGAQGGRAPDAVVLAAQEQIAAGRLEEARAALVRALRSFPEDGGLHNLLGIVAAQQDRLPEAESHFTSAVRLAPKLAGAHLNLGRAYEQRGAYADAAAVYRKLLTFDAGNAEGREALKRARCGAVRTVPACRGVPEEDLLALAPTLWNSGVLERVLDGGSSSAALRLLGGIHEKHGRTAEARSWYEQAARKEPDHAEPLVDLARLAYAERAYEKAVAYLAHAREREPSDPSIHFFYGMACVEANLPAEARQALSKAVELAPDEPSYRYALGAVTLQGFGAADAIPHFESYARSKPGDARGRFALGVALFQAARYEEAAREFSAIREAKETSAGAHYYLGRIARQDGRAADAAALFRKAVELAPEFPDARAELGLALLRSGDSEGARREIERAVALDAHNRPANRSLLVLYQQTKDARAESQRERVAELEKRRDELMPLLLRKVEIQK